MCVFLWRNVEGQGVRAVWGEGERDGPKLKLRRGGRREAWKDGREGNTGRKQRHNIALHWRKKVLEEYQ